MLEVIAIGGSLGGLRAVQQILKSLPRGFSLPVAITLHRHRESLPGMAEVLCDTCVLPVQEADDKDPLLPGHVLIAPADYHLLVEQGHVALSTDPPVNYARPSIDVLFESAADAYGKGVLAVLLTGASADGAAGMAYIHQRGGRTLVQDPASAECAVMPQSALDAAPIDLVLPLAEIGSYLAGCARKSAHDTSTTPERR